VHRSPSNLVARQPAAPLDAAASPAAAPSEAIAGAQPMAASASPSVDEAPSTDITQLADRVYDLLVGRLLIERERRGLWR
jgi:hypothetical protein